MWNKNSAQFRDPQCIWLLKNLLIHCSLLQCIYTYVKAFVNIYLALWASLVAQMVKNPLVMQEAWVRSLGWEDSLEKGTATHSSILAWRIPWMEEPGRLQSLGLLRVGHDWATSLSLFTFTHWRRKWQPTPVFLPGESQRSGTLVGCCLWGHTESDTTEVT